MNRRLLILPCLLALVACVSDKRLVQDATAAQMYAAHDYMRECVAVKGPPECKSRQVTINQLKDEVDICNEVQKIGSLPKKARGRLRLLTKQADQ